MLAALAACAPRPPQERPSSGMVSDGAEPSARRAADAAPGVEEIDSSTELGDSAVLGPSVADAAAPVVPGGAAVQADADAATPAASSADPDNTLWRDDGRPVWWLAAPAVEGERVQVTAEAMAETVVLARRRAIDAARRALAAAAPQGRTRETVDALLVRALAADAPGRSRYVAYARVSAAPRAAQPAP